LGNVDQAVHVGRVDDIADIDLSDAGDAIDRRGEIGVAEIDLRAFDDRLVGLNRGDELINNCLLRVGELLRDRFLLGEVGVTIEVDLGILQVRLVAVAIGNGLSCAWYGRGSITASTSPFFTC
jgi:hypothetical protein